MGASGPAQSEMVLGPDHERGPVAAGVCKRPEERVRLRRGHAHVDGALGHREHAGRGIPQELIELAAESIVVDGELLRRLAFVRDVVRRIGEHHVSQPTSQDLLDVGHLRGIPTDEPVFAKNPHVARHRDRALCFIRDRVFVCQPFVCYLRIRQDLGEFRVCETDQVEVERVFLQRVEFDAKHLVIPACV
jgi:hypothetical protein